jgi:hypothetical protein
VVSVLSFDDKIGGTLGPLVLDQQTRAQLNQWVGELKTRDYTDISLAMRKGIDLMVAGRRHIPGPNGVPVQAGEHPPIAYETLLIDPTRPPERPKPGYVLSAAVLARVAPFGAAGQAPARKRRRATAVTM